MNDIIEKYHSNYIFCLIPLSRIFYLLAFSIVYTSMVLNEKKSPSILLLQGPQIGELESLLENIPV